MTSMDEWIKKIPVDGSGLMSKSVTQSEQNIKFQELQILIM